MQQQQQQEDAVEEYDNPGPLPIAKLEVIHNLLYYIILCKECLYAILAYFLSL